MICAVKVAVRETANSVKGYNLYSKIGLKNGTNVPIALAAIKSARAWGALTDLRCVPCLSQAEADIYTLRRFSAVPSEMITKAQS